MLAISEAWYTRMRDIGRMQADMRRDLADGFCNVVTRMWDSGMIGEKSVYKG